ncbi:ATP-binding protein [Streptomyces sp. NPDC050564]|uniref:ATP-binding protein n=1 Tax=Streptomyces sp. NPDC050564 TaxID=3365631 RepID=UPI0037A886EA
MVSTFLRPELPADAAPLMALERRAVALSAIGRRTAELRSELGLKRLGPLWEGVAEKLGVDRQQGPLRQAGFVFRARVHGMLDQPDPEDPGPLAPDVFALVRAYALGKTQKQHAQDWGVPIWQLDEVARLARKCLNGALTQPNVVYRALPQLLRAIQTPLDPGTGMQAAAASAPLLQSLSTELPGDNSALYLARIWSRTSVTALGWKGDILKATEVITRLVDNAVRHGGPDGAHTAPQVLLRAAITEAGELVIDVSDLNPSFPEFSAAVQGERGRGLQRIAQHGAQLTWFLHHPGPGKTVRAHLSPEPRIPEPALRPPSAAHAADCLGRPTPAKARG